MTLCQFLIMAAAATTLEEEYGKGSLHRKYARSHDQVRRLREIKPWSIIIFNFIKVTTHKNQTFFLVSVPKSGSSGSSAASVLTSLPGWKGGGTEKKLNNQINFDLFTFSQLKECSCKFSCSSFIEGHSQLAFRSYRDYVRKDIPSHYLPCSRYSPLM